MKQHRRWSFWLLVPLTLTLVMKQAACRPRQRPISQAATRALLRESVQLQPRLAVVKKLIAQGADVNAHDADGRTALQRAAFAGETALMQVLLAYGANPNDSLHNDDPTPLMFAVQHNEPQGVKLLLAKGAKPNLKRNIYGLGSITALKFLRIKADTAEFDSHNIEVRKEKQIEQLLLKAGAKA